LKYAVADKETNKNTNTPNKTPRITATFDCFFAEAGEDSGAAAAGGGESNLGGKSGPSVLSLGAISAGRVLGGVEGGRDFDGLGTGAFPETAESGAGTTASFLSARSCTLKSGEYLCGLRLEIEESEAIA